MSEGFKNMDKLLTKVKKIEKVFDTRMTTLLQSAGQTIRGNAVKLIQVQSPGAPYKRYKPARTGFASPPGSPPNTDTGKLVKDIQVRTLNAKTITIGTSAEGAPHGKLLEYGTSKMEKRPWLDPAWNLSKDIIGEKAKKQGLDLLTQATK